MPNWRAVALEPILTAAIALGVVSVTWIAMLIPTGGIGYLPIALFLGTFYPLILAFPWVAFTAIFSWLVRRRSHWLRLAMGGCASILLAGLAVSPIIISTITSAEGVGRGSGPVVAFAIVVILAVSLVQFFVHLALRVRQKREVTPELG